MQFHGRRNHMIDVLFPVALLFVFSLSALTLILLAARIYQSTTENSSLHDTSRTSLSYISEKIHQSDMDGAVSLGIFDGCDALVIEEAYGNDIYYTYIYAYGQELKELYVKEGVAAYASDGRTILEIRDFSMERLSAGLFRFGCTDAKGREASSIVSIRSRQPRAQQQFDQSKTPPQAAAWLVARGDKEIRKDGFL